MCVCAYIYSCLILTYRQIHLRAYYIGFLLPSRKRNKPSSTKQPEHDTESARRNVHKANETDDMIYRITAVSYTHLDVYKRQV